MSRHRDALRAQGIPRTLAQTRVQRPTTELSSSPDCLLSDSTLAQPGDLALEELMRERVVSAEGRDYFCGGDQAGLWSFQSGFCDRFSCPLPSAFMT
jgi:hypothetical protein